MEEENDFGFTTTDTIIEKVTVVDASAEERIKRLEGLIMPLLLNLKKNPENAYIHWPNRAEIIDKQIAKIQAVVNPLK